MTESKETTMNQGKYVEKVQEHLDDLEAKITDLAAKAEQAEAKAKSEYEERLAELRSKRDNARTRLETLKQAGNSAWRDLASGLDKAINEMDDAINQAMAHFS